MDESGQQSGKLLVRKAEYARMRGWDKSYLSKKDIKERLAPAMEGKLLNVARADEIFKVTTDPAQVRKPAKLSGAPLLDAPAGAGAKAGEDLDAGPGNAPGGVVPGSMEDLRIRQTMAKLEQELLDLAERKDETLPKAATLSAVASAGASIREYLETCSRRISEQAATMSDAREIKVMVDGEHRAMLEMVSHDFMQRVSREGAGEKTVN